MLASCTDRAEDSGACSADTDCAAVAIRGASSTPPLFDEFVEEIDGCLLVCVCESVLDSGQ